MRRRAALLAGIVLVLSATAWPATASAGPKASLTDIEGEVMCVSCREPLNVAQSAQADDERDFIRRLIARGETKAQIEQALVAQYGTSVLGRPPAHGFNLTVYVLPPAILVVGLVVLGVTLPRWRRLTRDALAARTGSPDARRLDPADARRLDEDLARRV